MMVLKRSVQFAILILLAMSVKFGWNYLQNGGIFPISVVKVEADYAHLSPEELQQTISNDLPASFWTVDVRSLKSRLQTIEWVQSVDIQKVWPETLKIRVNEKKVMAQWGKDGFLSNKEEIFYPDKKASVMDSTNAPDLPMLYGPASQVKTIVKQYYMMEKMLVSKNMEIKTLYMSRSGAWFIKLTNGTVLLLGREKPLERLKRFLVAYESILAKNDESADGQVRFARRVDLRYPHGMAILWANESTTTKAASVN